MNAGYFCLDRTISAQLGQVYREHIRTVIQHCFVNLTCYHMNFKFGCSKQGICKHSILSGHH